MKAEFWTIVSCGIFFGFSAVLYGVITSDPTGTTALIMTTLLCVLLGFYLFVVVRQIEPRPEDREAGEIAEGAGEQGFYPPYSWWPLFAGMAFGTIVLGVVFGWWLFIIGAGFGATVLVGWIFEYYRGIHAH